LNQRLRSWIVPTGAENTHFIVEVCLLLSHGQGGWPFPYVFELHFLLFSIKIIHLSMF